MNTNQIILLACACLLAFGVFMPLVNMPFLGSINYFHNGEGDGKYILILAGIAAALTFTRFIKAMAIPGLIAIMILGSFLMNYQEKFSSFQNAMGNTTGLFSGLAQTLSQSISLSYGYIVMAISSLAITILPFWLDSPEGERPDLQ